MTNVIADKANFIKDRILETLSLDHENYEMLCSEVIDMCKQHSIIIGEKDFRYQLLSLISERKVDACLYDEKAHDLVPRKFDTSKLGEYWFKSKRSGSE